MSLLFRVPEILARCPRAARAALACLPLVATPVLPAWSQEESLPATRAPAAPALVPEPEVVAVMMGVWTAQIPDEFGGSTGWRLKLQPDGRFNIQLTADGQTEVRSGTYEIDARSVRLIFPGMADDSDPNSTALNLSDARSLETYFYRLLGANRLAFRPTLCRVDPCQWIAERAE
ncbi:MAG: hypothetical protein ACFCVH_00600 [Alphaproteobacteria bacterium]